jgi:hypothetical protein
MWRTFFVLKLQENRKKSDVRIFYLILLRIQKLEE